MTLTSPGDKGQRYEVSAVGYPFDGQTCVIGWAEQMFDAARMASAVLQAPSCSSVSIRDRWTKTDVTPWYLSYAPPWRIQDREIVDRYGRNVLDIEMDADEVKFWVGVVDAVNRTHVGESCFPYAEEVCPGHVASVAEAKVCGRCGIHVDGLRPDDGDPINLQGSGPAPIVPRGAP